MPPHALSPFSICRHAVGTACPLPWSVFAPWAHAGALTMENIETLKAFLVVVLDLSRDALHVHIGLAVFAAVVLIGRHPLGAARPWCVVMLLALLGEVVDVGGDHLRGQPLRWDASVHDVLNTVLWPTILTLVPRWRSRRRAAADRPS